MKTKSDIEVNQFVENVHGNIIADALIQITQEINAVMLYMKHTGYKPREIVGAVNRALSENDIEYFSKLLNIHGNNLISIGQAVGASNSGPGGYERHLIDLMFNHKEWTKPTIINNISSEYMQSLEQDVKAQKAKATQHTAQ